LIIHRQTDTTQYIISCHHTDGG